MSDKNMIYQSIQTWATFMKIQQDIQTKLLDKKTEYDAILANFTDSDCIQATAVRNMLAKEKELLDALVGFYSQVLIMLQDACDDIDKTEELFSGEHLTKK
ncbi:MAG: hypothetical protein IKY23_01640 [Lachnospiraceae bacterium]|nr:hypothetical protein [Lachnospiraceae bacterium]